MSLRRKLLFLGEWYGIEWDDDGRGKHNGTHGGIQYFQCRYVFWVSALTGKFNSFPMLREHPIPFS